MSKMFRINVSFPRNIWCVHVKKLCEQLDRAFRPNIDGLHEGDHEGDQELHVDVRTFAQTIQGKRRTSTSAFGQTSSSRRRKTVIRLMRSCDAVNCAGVGYGR